MRTLKLSALAAASALSLGLAATANASVFVEVPSGLGGGGLVSPTGPVIDALGIEFINEVVTPTGDLDADDNTATATVGAGVTRVGIDFNVDQAIPSGPIARGIQNFSVSVTGDMGTMFQVGGITDAEGFLQFSGPAFFDVMSGELLTFVFDGTAFQLGAQTAGYSVGAFAVNPVPVPAAGLLFGTAALGGAIARRKRKSA